MLVSKNEGDMFINSLTNLDEEKIVDKLKSYPALKGIISSGLVLSGILGYSFPIFAPIFGVSTAITELIVDDKDEQKFINMRLTNLLITDFFDGRIGENVKTKIAEVKSNDNKINKDPHNCTVDDHLKKLTTIIDNHNYKTFKNYDEIKFYCYVFKTIITWQCNTKELTQEGETVEIIQPVPPVQGGPPLEPKYVNPNTEITTTNILQGPTQNIDVQLEEDVKQYFEQLDPSSKEVQLTDPVILENIEKLRNFVQQRFNLSNPCTAKITSKNDQLKPLKQFVYDNDFVKIKNMLCSVNASGGKKSRKNKKRKTQKRLRKGKTIRRR
jgi:hypothetical protein